MEGIFRNFLFTRHILVNDRKEEPTSEEILATLITLSAKFDIRIDDGLRFVTPQMIQDAAENLGEYIPEPFYRGFPQSVRKLSKNELLFDQMIHYAQTYGTGIFDVQGHSLLEQICDRPEFSEHTDPKHFIVLKERDAEDILIETLRGLLRGTRPLNPDITNMIAEGWKEYGERILPDRISCKRTAAELFYRTGERIFAKDLKLPDTIKLLEYIQYTQYGSEKLNKLNLRNRDRKLLTYLIDSCLGEHDPKVPPRIFLYPDICECFEKRKIWCGLLHHIHYKPKNEAGNVFTDLIRNDGWNWSALSAFEKCMADGKPVEAAKKLLAAKGAGALARNLDYILSRCSDEQEAKEVLACLE